MPTITAMPMATTQDPAARTAMAEDGVCAGLAEYIGEYEGEGAYGGGDFLGGGGGGDETGGGGGGGLPAKFRHVGVIVVEERPVAPQRQEYMLPLLEELHAPGQELPPEQRLYALHAALQVASEVHGPLTYCGEGVETAGGGGGGELMGDGALIATLKLVPVTGVHAEPE